MHLHPTLLWTKPSPHWYGTRTKGMMPNCIAMKYNWLISSNDRIEYSRSMKRQSKPALWIIWTICWVLTIFIPNACFGINNWQIKSIRNLITLHSLPWLKLVINLFEIVCTMIGYIGFQYLIILCIWQATKFFWLLLHRKTLLRWTISSDFGYRFGRICPRLTSLRKLFQFSEIVSISGENGNESRSNSYSSGLTGLLFDYHQEWKCGIVLKVNCSGRIYLQ